MFEGIGLLKAPGVFHGLTADLENLIRVVTRLARKLADDHPELTTGILCFPGVCFSQTMVSRLEDTRQSNGLFGADNEEHGFTTAMPSEIETFRISAMKRYLQEQAKDATSRAQHTTRKENVNLESGTWIMLLSPGLALHPSQGFGWDPLASS